MEEEHNNHTLPQIARLEPVTVVGYAHWAPYFVNGDGSGLENDDQAEADAWLDWALDYCEAEYGPVDVGEESDFGRPDGPGARLRGDVVEYTFLRRVAD